MCIHVCTCVYVYVCEQQLRLLLFHAGVFFDIVIDTIWFWLYNYCVLDFCDECIHVLELPSDLLYVITHMPGTRTEKSNTIQNILYGPFREGSFN